MQILRSKESIYTIGVLWNMGNKFVREMMLRIAIMQDVIQVTVYDLKDEYDAFVLDTYKGDDEAFQDGYIYEKIKNMKSTNNTKVIVFAIKIDNPTYRINDENGMIQCLEARKVKQQIRDEYASKIDGYFFDNLIHMSDNEEETQRIQSILKRYEKYIEEDYIRKGYQPIMSTTKKVENKTYISLLNKLRGEEER